MDALLATIIAELRPRLPGWYPDADPAAEPVVVHDDERAVARVIRMRVARVGAQPVGVIVKAGSVAPAGDGGDERPRLVPTTEGSIRRTLEFEALEMVRGRLEEVGDPRFVAVRPLGVLPESTALVMEELDGRPLHRLLAQRLLRRRSSTRPRAVASAAGRLLRVLHDTPPSGQAVRQGRPAELVAAFEAFGEHLASAGIRRLEPVVAAGADAAASLPDPLPTVISHGDFAPRNLLVDRAGRLALIDLLARWQAPPYEDLATFLVALDTSRPNAATRGALFGRAIEQLETPFLAGYFGSEPVPRRAIRVYELLLLLDKWSARAIRNQTLRGVRRVPERWIDRHFAARSRLLARRLREVA